MKTRNQNKSNMKSDRIMEKKTNITEKDLSLFLGNQEEEIDDENMTQTKAQSAPIYGGNNN